MKRILKLQNNYYPSKKQEKKSYSQKNLWSQDFFDINTKRWGFIEYYMLLGKDKKWYQLTNQVEIGVSQ